MSTIEWRVGDVTATTIYHDMYVDGDCIPNAWIAEYTVEGKRVFQFVHTKPQLGGGFQHRTAVRDTFDEAKAAAAMHFAEIELERP